MKLINIFKKKKKEKIVEEDIIIPEYPLCGICGFEMKPYEKTTKYGNGRFHIKCLRKYKKQVIKEQIK